MRLKSPWCDLQDEVPTAYCSRCFGEIYAESEDIQYIDGKPVCSDCLWEEESL